MKSQGLPLNTIVLAALAVLVLLLVVGFTTGSLSKIFGGMGQQISKTDIDVARTTCKNLCLQLQQEAKAGILTKSAAENSEYAKKTFVIDLDGDGKISSSEKDIHCWESPINEKCTVSIVTPSGTIYTCEGKGNSYICS